MMTFAHAKQPFPTAPALLHEALIQAQYVLATITNRASDKLVFKTLSRFHEKLKEIDTLLTILELSPLSAEKGMNLSKLKHLINAELTAYECQIREMKVDKIYEEVSNWLSCYEMPCQEGQALAAE